MKLLVDKPFLSTHHPDTKIKRQSVQVRQTTPPNAREPTVPLSPQKQHSLPLTRTCRGKKMTAGAAMAWPEPFRIRGTHKKKKLNPHAAFRPWEMLMFQEARRDESRPRLTAQRQTLPSKTARATPLHTPVFSPRQACAEDLRSTRQPHDNEKTLSS